MTIDFTDSRLTLIIARTLKAEAGGGGGVGCDGGGVGGAGWRFYLPLEPPRLHLSFALKG